MITRVREAGGTGTESGRENVTTAAEVRGEKMLYCWL